MNGPGDKNGPEEIRILYREYLALAERLERERKPADGLVGM